jgi:hypothetical protein
VPDAASETSFRPLGAILGWVFPGLGHIASGNAKRGIMAMAGVLILFFGGLLVGGVDCVDRTEDRLWFFGQACCGPIAFAADKVNEMQLKSGAAAPLPKIQLGTSFSLLSFAYRHQQRLSCFALLTQRMLVALALALVNAGSSMAAKIAMIAITTSSSIKVNASGFVCRTSVMGQPQHRRSGSQRQSRIATHQRARASLNSSAPETSKTAKR